MSEQTSFQDLAAALVEAQKLTGEIIGPAASKPTGAIVIYPPRPDVPGEMHIAPLVLLTHADFDKWTDGLFRAAEAVWPAETAVAPEPGPVEPAKPKTPRKEKPPAPGSFTEMVRDAVQRLNTYDTTTLADAIDCKTQLIPAALARLRKTGCLPAVQS